MKRKYVARFLSLGLTAALGACLALPAGAANAPVYTGELCPVCGEGWLMETEVVMSRDAVAKAPCAHGDATATDYTSEVQCWIAADCNRCGYGESREAYQREETSCSLDFAPVPTPPATVAEPVAYTGSPLSLAEDLLAQARAAGLRPGQMLVAEHNRAQYLVHPTMLYEGWDAWQADLPDLPLPQSIGDYTWSAARPSDQPYFSDAATFETDARRVHDYEDWQTGAVLDAGPVTAATAFYNTGSYAAFTVTLRRAPAAVTGETVAIDGVPVTIQYDADGRCTAVAWQDEGLSLTLEPMNISTTAATAALVDLVQAEQDALTAWAA